MGFQGIREDQVFADVTAQAYAVVQRAVRSTFSEEVGAHLKRHGKFPYNNFIAKPDSSLNITQVFFTRVVRRTFR